MTHLAQKIDQFLNEVILKAENQHEILIGSCTSDAFNQYAGAYFDAFV